MRSKDSPVYRGRVTSVIPAEQVVRAIPVTHWPAIMPPLPVTKWCYHYG
jgi:hypothetical protein